MNNAIKSHVASSMSNPHLGPGMFSNRPPMMPIAPGPLKFAPSVPSLGSAGTGAGAALKNSGNKLNASTDALLDDIDAAANGDYDGATDYMKKLEADIEQKKIQQQKEEKAILDKGIKEQNDAKLAKEYEEYQKTQKENQAKEKSLKDEQETQKQKLKDAKTEEERSAIQEQQKATQKSLDDLRAKQGKEAHQMYYDYDQALEKTNKNGENDAKRKDLYYLHKRGEDVQKLEQDFNNTKRAYFVDPKTGDWRTKAEFDALPDSDKEVIRTGYKKGLIEDIKPTLERLKGAFGDGKSTVDQSSSDIFRNQQQQSYTRLQGDLRTTAPTERYTIGSNLDFSNVS